MASRSKMRLDIRRFERERLAAAILISVVFVAAVVAFTLIGSIESVATSYTDVRGHEIPSSIAFDKVLKEHHIVAVMFESPTCPLCRKMHPYWEKLEETKPHGIAFYHVVYSPATQDIFGRYHVTETPTYIVFVDGKAVGRTLGEFPGPNITDSMLEWVLQVVSFANTSRLETSSKASHAESNSVARAGFTLFSLIAAVAAGVAATFSPCVLPMLLAYVAGATGRRVTGGEAGGCAATAMVGALGIAALFAFAGGLAAFLQGVLLPAAAAAIIAAGIASILDVPFEVRMGRTAKLGLLGSCGLYGLLAVQCSLPIVAGALFLAAAGGLATGLLTAIAFAAGLGVSLATVLYAASRASTLAERITAKSKLITRIGGVVMVVAGVYLLAYGVGLV